VLVAGAPIRGLGSAELGVLREAVAASSIPVGADTAELERAFIGANLLATGRRTEADRRLVLRELDELRGVPYRPDAESAAAAHVAAPHASSAPDQGSGLGDDDRDVGREADDLEAEQQLTAAARTRTLRRVALGVFALVCVATVALLVVLVVMESLGTDFGTADEDPLVAAMSVTILAALLTGILWATAADFDDARRRALSREWLEAASPEQLARGLPSPFHAAWMRAPGGRMGGLALLVLGMLAMVAVVGGPVALAGSYAPPVVGVVATVIGVMLGGVALWAWFARRRAYARRVEWLLEVAGARVTGDNSLAG
jgi:hypothetical protein